MKKSEITFFNEKVRPRMEAFLADWENIKTDKALASLLIKHRYDPTHDPWMLAKHVNRFGIGAFALPDEYLSSALKIVEMRLDDENFEVEVNPNQSWGSRLISYTPGKELAVSLNKWHDLTYVLQLRPGVCIENKKIPGQAKTTLRLPQPEEIRRLIFEIDITFPWEDSDWEGHSDR